ncbi:MAG: DsrE/DsrF/DrsH-like family protein [Candidatus Thermoplasmatota archaeon]|jgi:peroxiredoxin family protein|nr:DsrE/DsrF/DrsH-like family protein [Candidatus Thermoplasmatota archaeon]
MVDKASIVLASGTVDKLMAGSIIVSGAVANEMEVNVFVTFWALMEMRKNAGENTKLGVEGKGMEKQLFSIMKEKKVPSWKDTLKQAMEVGDVHVYGCAMFADLMGIGKDDLDPMIEEVIGVSQFVDMAKDSKMTLFI